MIIKSDISWDEYFLNIAKDTAKKSKDPSTKCGCVLVDKNNGIICTGFNGLPQCVIDKEEYLLDRDIKLQIILHAEENAFCFVDNSARLIDATVYTWPIPPCAKCASQCLQRKILRFVAPEVEKGSRWEKSIQLSEKNSERIR
jgi:dCMP deaminase